MGATTNHGVGIPNELLSKLMIMWAQVTQLILHGNRNEAEARVLLRAIQLFKERRLQDVVVGSTGGSSLLTTFSILIEDSLFSDEMKEYLRKRGLRYVGELARVNFMVNGHHTYAKFRQRLFQEALEAYGLSLENPPSIAEWQPPYWQSQPFLEALSMSIEKLRNPPACHTPEWQSHRRFVVARDAAYKPISDFVRHFYASLSGDDEEEATPEFLREVPKVTYPKLHRCSHAIQQDAGTIGDFLRGLQQLTPGYLKDVQDSFGDIKEVWAGAVIPSGWSRSAEAEQYIQSVLELNDREIMRFQNELQRLKDWIETNKEKLVIPSA